MSTASLLKQIVVHNHGKGLICEGPCARQSQEMRGMQLGRFPLAGKGGGGKMQLGRTLVVQFDLSYPPRTWVGVIWEHTSPRLVVEVHCCILPETESSASHTSH